MSSPRLIAAAICTVAAIVAALYLAGFGARALLGVDTAGFGVGTWIAYARVVDHPQVAPYAWRIGLAGGLAGALMLLVWLAMMVMLFKLRSHRNLHGRARFAGLLDLARAGFLRRWIRNCLRHVSISKMEHSPLNNREKMAGFCKGLSHIGAKKEARPASM